MIDVKWNRFIQEVLRMNERPRICFMLPLPRPLPLADAIQQNVARFLSSADEEPVDDLTNRMQQLGFLPSNPLSERSSRMPTSSSSEGWEYLPLDRWKDCGFSQEALDAWPSDLESAARMGVLRTDGHPNVLCYTIYSDDETQQAVQRAPETLQLPLLSLAKLQPKAPPKPPFNLFPPPPKAAVPSKAAPPPKAAPVSMGPPPLVMPPVKSPPNTRPSKAWNKKKRLG